MIGGERAIGRLVCEAEHVAVITARAAVEKEEDWRVGAPAHLDVKAGAVHLQGGERRIVVDRRSDEEPRLTRIMHRAAKARSRNDENT